MLKNKIKIKRLKQNSSIITTFTQYKMTIRQEKDRKKRLLSKLKDKLK